ncbi:MAG: L-threonylcarbamoyladenylate synthase [Chloroflexi bacterium]|nr:L-threonylcarbamoyladenylate synthase [Chloroflexota bacterium]
MEEKTKLVRVDPSHPESEVVAEAAELLLGGRLVAFPTDTVYGIAADATNEAAVLNIFKVKKRPRTMPLVVLVAEPSGALELFSHVPTEAEALANRFWPGPLTIILPGFKALPLALTAGAPTLGVRCPNSAVAREVIRATKRPLATTSANITGCDAPIDAQGVLEQLGGRIPLILDGGPAKIGVASTIVDLSARPARVLREGSVTKEALARYVAVE